jgi:tetratricopeptide (TPR) repeat protein
MTVRVRRVSSTLGILLMLGPFAAPAFAQPPVPIAATPTSPEAAARALEHFQKAKELYLSGAYREAIAELLAARDIDPNAKDLVFNLGVVNEKLGHIEEALKYFRLYATMDLLPDERARAEAYIKRLEGAKTEIVVPTVSPPPTVAPPPPVVEPKRGRVDAATILAGGVAIVGVGVGIGFGVKALADKPKANFVTGPDGTYDQLVSETNTSHAEAIVADVGFSVGLAASLFTAYLYFGRLKNRPSSSTSGASVSVTPLEGGGAFFLVGSF